MNCLLSIRMRSGVEREHYNLAFYYGCFTSDKMPFLKRKKRLYINKSVVTPTSGLTVTTKVFKAMFLSLPGLLAKVKY